MHTQEEIEKSQLELAECLVRLQKNKDFMKVIGKAYLEDGTKFLTRNMTKVKEEVKPEIIKELEARSNLWKFLDGVEEASRSILEAREM